MGSVSAIRQVLLLGLDAALLWFAAAKRDSSPYLVHHLSTFFSFVPFNISSFHFFNVRWREVLSHGLAREDSCRLLLQLAVGASQSGVHCLLDGAKLIVS